MRTYIHQLYDNRTDVTYQANFGMIETDFRRKAHYGSLENMLDIVVDPAANAGTIEWISGSRELLTRSKSRSCNLRR